MTRKTLLTAGLMGAALAFVASDAFAHGGSHPTPWPNPDGSPSPSPGPGPSPSPSPSPTPSPSPSGPSTRGGGSPTPSSGGGITGGPSGPTKPRSGGKPSGELVWEHWWQLNKWNYTRVGRRVVQVSGDSGSKGDGARRERPAVAFLKTCLKDDYFDIRSAACIALGKTGDKTVASVLVPLIHDSHPGVQESALLALGMLRDTRNIEHLMRVLSAKGRYKDRLRATAALGLGFIRDQAATPQLLKILGAGDDDEVRAAAVVALGLLRDKSAAEPLYRIVNKARGKTNERLRAYAVTALGKLGLQEFQIKRKKVSVVSMLTKMMFTDRSKHVKRSAVLALGAIGTEKTIFNLAKVVKTEKDAMTRNFAMLAMARLASSDKAKLHVRRTLENVLLMGKDYSGKGFSAIGLGLLKDQSAARALRQAFDQTTEPSNKSAAAIGLGLLPDKDSTMRLLGQIQLGSDAKVKGYCCVALGMLRAKQAVEEMRRVLKRESNPELRAAAAVALANVGDKEALDTLKKALNEKNNYLKMTTALAIGYFRDAAVVKPLIDAYGKEKSNEVKAIMVVALGYIVDPNEVPVLKEVSTDFNYLLHYPSIDLVLRLF